MPGFGSCVAAGSSCPALFLCRPVISCQGFIITISCFIYFLVASTYLTSGLFYFFVCIYGVPSFLFLFFIFLRRLNYIFCFVHSMHWSGFLCIISLKWDFKFWKTFFSQLLKCWEIWCLFYKAIVHLTVWVCGSCSDMLCKSLTQIKTL